MRLLISVRKNYITCGHTDKLSMPRSMIICLVDSINSAKYSGVGSLLCSLECMSAFKSFPRFPRVPEFLEFAPRLPPEHMKIRQLKPNKSWGRCFFFFLFFFFGGRVKSCLNPRKEGSWPLRCLKLSKNRDKVVNESGITCKNFFHTSINLS